MTDPVRPEPVYERDDAAPQPVFGVLIVAVVLALAAIFYTATTRPEPRAAVEAAP